MDHFAYAEGTLRAEAVPLPEIAAAVGTPVYVYAAATLRRHLRVFREAVAPLRHPDAPEPLVAFAVKANSNLAVLRLLANEGAGADIVSEGELRRALAAEIPPERIVFSGVGKTREEIGFALAQGIYQINAESIAELRDIAACAAALEIRADVALRLNPDVDSGTHAKIATGHGEAKFGIAVKDLPHALAFLKDTPSLRLVGLAVHIGSQITTLEPFAAACRTLAGLATSLQNDGWPLERLDLGGGLGIPYERGKAAPPLPAEYSAVLTEALSGVACRLIFEPGRMIAGNAGVLLASVVRVKQGEARRVIIIDAAMNDLIRPALYDAWHDIVPVKQPADGAADPADVVGPVCESGDTFARNRPLPPLLTGDLVAILSAGAYGAVQASMYNSRLLVPEALVDGARFDIVRCRPTFDEMLAQDRIPAWLKPVSEADTLD